jgi:hypothetical protein
MQRLVVQQSTRSSPQSGRSRPSTPLLLLCCPLLRNQKGPLARVFLCWLPALIREDFLPELDILLNTYRAPTSHPGSLQSGPKCPATAPQLAHQPDTEAACLSKPTSKRPPKTCASQIRIPFSSQGSVQKGAQVHQSIQSPAAEKDKLN